MGITNYLVFFILLTFIHQPWFVYLLWFVPLYAFFRPTINTMITDYTYSFERSRGIGITIFTSNLAMTLGTIYGGYAADILSLNMEFWTIFPAILIWFALIVTIFGIKESLKNPYNYENYNEKS